MNKTYQKSFPDNKNAGFTLIELLVVVLIIGILAAVTLPQYQLAVDKARFAEMQTICHSLSKMIEMYYMANGKYPEYWSELDMDIQGCEDLGYALHDMVCQRIRIDLNSQDFRAWDGTKRKSLWGLTIEDNYNYIYYFLHAGLSAKNAGKFQCKSTTDRGKRLCRSICGTESCYID